MKHLLCVITFLATAVYLNGQNVADTAFIRASIKNSIAVYEAAISGQELYYNGTAYIELRRTETEHPYFLFDELQAGTVNFSGESFENVYLLYDATSDKVISEAPNSSLIVLNRTKLKSFTIRGHQFEKFEGPAQTLGLPESAFYEILYNGRTRVIALHKKRFQEQFDSREAHVYFDKREFYFVFHNGKFHQVKSKGSILKLFPNQKGEIKAILKKDKVQFKQHRESALARIAEIHDRLTDQ